MNPGPPKNPLQENSVKRHPIWGAKLKKVIAEKYDRPENCPYEPPKSENLKPGPPKNPPPENSAKFTPPENQPTSDSEKTPLPKNAFQVLKSANQKEAITTLSARKPAKTKPNFENQQQEPSQPTITKMLIPHTNQPNPKPPPIQLKPPKLKLIPNVGPLSPRKPNLEEETQTQNQTTKPRSSRSKKPNKKPDQRTLLDMIKPTKPIETDKKPECETKPKPDHEYETKPKTSETTSRNVTIKTKPAKPTKPGKSSVLQKPDLKLFLAQKKQQRVNNMKKNLNVPTPSISHDRATLPCTIDPLLLKTPLASDVENENAIIERDTGSSARSGDLSNLSGDLLLADKQKNLGE